MHPARRVRLVTAGEGRSGTDGRSGGRVSDNERAGDDARESAGNDQADGQKDGHAADRDWRPYFGHDEPYGDQADGIDTAVSAGRDGGYLLLEGACGTGKTMLALTTGIHLVRDSDTDYERVFVLTSVKQQLRQFEEDLRTINDELPEDRRPVSGLTLVGKPDVCPYNRENAGDIDDATVYERCENLRERTRNLTDETTAGSLAERARSQQVGLADSGRQGSADPGGADPGASESGGADPGASESGGADPGASESGGATYLETADVASPYPRETPESGGETGDVEYCPFYAQYLADRPEEGDPVEAVPFDVDAHGHLEPEDLVALSVEHGTCPHSMMGAILRHAEVIVGNYYHAFDPTTVETFTGALLDESTFVVCDEAHMLEPRVRDLVSGGVADTSLRNAERELAQVIQPVTLGDDQSPVPGALVEEELTDATVSLSDLETVREFVRELRGEIDRRVTAHLDAEHEGWQSDLADLEDEEIPLRDPDEPAPDELTEWADGEGYGEAWTRAEPVGAVVGRILDAAEEERAGDETVDTQRAAPGVGQSMATWKRADHSGFFREIELERTWDDSEPTGSWRRAYNARLAMHNCVPGDAIGTRLAEFGGGVLMSATLAPLDVFRAVTGLDRIASSGRPVVERTYGLGFPAENRASFAVAAPKFTYADRGAPGEDTEVRRLHADAIVAVASCPGNVLVGMPSYAEAEWAAGVLEPRVEKPVLIDEASADDVTEDLKAEFFAGAPKVLVTSLRGTLTEGVDYRGDRLRAAVVCGVPIVNTTSPRVRAVRAAYDRRFGSGFETALAVPAVRKARQAVGRVIRGPEEVGVRVLLDERYARDEWDSVRPLLGPDREEFQPVSSDMLELGLDRFWNSVE